MSKNKTHHANEALPIFLIIETYKSWRNDRTLRLGAGLAYYGVFAIVPLLTLMIGVAAYFFSIQDVILYLQETMARIFGTELSSSLNVLVNKLADNPSRGTVSFSSIISLIALFVTASFIFVALQDALDTIWHNPIRLGFKKWVQRYLWAYIVVLLISSILFGVLVVNMLGRLATSILPGRFVLLESLASLVVSMSSWALGIAVLALVYRVMIYQKISWAILVIGSALTSVLIIVGTWLLGFYLNNYAGNSISGVVGAVLLLLIWIYYEAQIILVGAQFIKTLDTHKKRLPNIIKDFVSI